MSSKSTIEKFLSDLLASGISSRSVLANLARVSRDENVSVESLILKMGLLDGDALVQKLSASLGLQVLPPQAQVVPNNEMAEILGQEYLTRNSILPIQSEEDGLVLLTAEPLNQPLLKTIRFVLERNFKLQIAAKHQIKKLIEHTFPETATDDPTNLSTDEEEIRAHANEGPVVEAVQNMFVSALSQNASDIHLEAEKSGAKLRFRINGVLSEQEILNDVSDDAIVSRLKFLAQLNISERRKPQDGRIGFNFNGREIDLRLSILPTQYGQSAVIRILDQSQVSLNWSALGFEKNDADRIKSIVEKPNGLFLVTGPTGSGKTTTLYTAISGLNTAARKIVTIEDPIEYNLAGINQVQVNSSVGLTFASALRSILRQDPNVILIGEIRDAETAEMACRAALVGRTVLSTLHTNSPEQARTRLLDLGVAEYLIDATLIGVLGQNLEVQKCARCHGGGCEQCNQSGIGQRKLAYKILDA